MLAIMTEEVRRDIRGKFRKATSICLAVDESDGRKLVRCRCDTPTAPYKFDGVMGILTKNLGAHEATVAFAVTEDYAKVTHQNLKAFHRRFFLTGAKQFNWGHIKRQSRGRCATGIAQPAAIGGRHAEAQPVAITNKRKSKPILPQTLDEDGLEDYRRKVRVLASDGGPSERRALFLSATSKEFPNVHLVIKDMIHCIRIATQKPPHLVGEMEDVYNEIISKQHALLPDFKNSLKWKSVLEAVQVEVLKIPHLNLKGAMRYVLKHLAFAKQRMDSCADPLAKICMMLLPVAVVLALISSDARNAKTTRDRASNLLKKFKPKFTHALGVSADWGLISNDFLRVFDDGDHDIANSVDEEETFTKIFESVFVNGGVFQKTAQASAGGDEEPPAEFMTERVRQQSNKKCIFRCGEEHQVVWGPIGRSDLAELNLETRVAAKTTLDRIRADMTGARRDFQCLSLKRISVALGQDAGRGATMRSHLLQALKNLGRTFHLDRRMLQLEYEDALPVMFKCFQETHTDQRHSSKSFANLKVWNNLLDEQFVDVQFPARVAPFVELVALVRIWNSLIDGESTVERDFAHVRSFVRASKIATESIIEEMAVLKLSGPQNPEELASRTVDGDLIPTELILRYAEQWRKLYGARCGQAGTLHRKTRPKPPTRKLSFINVKRSVMKAAHIITREMSTREECVNTMYGVDSSFFGVPRGERKERTIVWNKRLQRFSDLSRTKNSINALQGSFGRSAFPRWKARRGCSAATAAPVMSRLAFMPPYNAAAGGAVSEDRYKEMGLVIDKGLHCCRLASIWIVDSLERLHGACPSEEWIICVIYIVAKGIPITTTKCCTAVGGDVRNLPRSNSVEHVPATNRNVVFTLQADFKRQYAGVVEAIRSCLGPDSKWKLQDPGKAKAVAKPKAKPKAKPVHGGPQGSGAAAAAGGADTQSQRPTANQTVRCEVGCLNDLWEVLQRVRRVVNSRTAPVLWMGERVGL